MADPIDVLAAAIRSVGIGHRAGSATRAEAAAKALTNDAIIDNAVRAVREHRWTAPDVAEMSERDLRALLRVAFHSVGGTS